MTDEKKLREVIKNSGYRMNHVAKMINLTYQGFLNKLTNKTEFTIPEMQNLCNLLNISAEDREIIFFANEVDETSSNK